MYRKWSLFTMPPVVLGGVFVVCAIPAYLLGGQARFNEKLIHEGERLRQLDRARITKEKQTAHA
ncbi:hypothetical protein QJS10_CPB20g02056 [Acorus calamus]|uniref:Uncharacterized protein n=1 Tax=Acorus calamus TaxID=4465 RepID=A0AAV9CC41_ACOCL|nr:hypothetical protein QJS10_CPB20g02056 [Acorus calamus]